MDLAKRTRDWLEALFPDGAGHLRSDARFEVDEGARNGLHADGFRDWCQAITDRCGGLELHVEEAVQRRNVVFASFHAAATPPPAERDGEGKPGPVRAAPDPSPGVAIVSWDQEGLILHACLMWTPPRPPVNAASEDAGPAPDSTAPSG